MAAPSRSYNYRKGVSIEVDRDEYNSLLRSMKNLPPAAQRELRADAARIADDIVIPDIKAAMHQTAPSFAPKLANSVRAGRDRKVRVIVGNDRGRKGSNTRYSGGATTNMLRYGTIEGVYQTANGTTAMSDGQSYRSNGRWQLWAEQVTGRWTQIASDNYTEDAHREWVKSVNTIVDDWNRGIRL